MLRDDLKAVCANASRKLLPLPAPELPGYAKEAADFTQYRVNALYVRELRGEDIVFVSKSETGLDDRLRWALRAIADGSGNRVFNDEDLQWIGGDGGLPTPLIERAYWAAREITGYTEENRRSFLRASTPAAAAGSPSS